MIEVIYKKDDVVMKHFRAKVHTEITENIIMDKLKDLIFETTESEQKAVEKIKQIIHISLDDEDPNPAETIEKIIEELPHHSV